MGGCNSPPRIYIMPNTTYSTVEPVGFGRSVFGEKSTDEIEKLYGRGFGDESTEYTEDNDK